MAQTETIIQVPDKDLNIQKMFNIFSILYLLRNSHWTMSEIFTNGSSYDLFTIIKTIYPEAEAYRSEKTGQIITRVADKFYDINGCVRPRFPDKFKKLVGEVEETHWNKKRQGATYEETCN